jgi:hypothetical protein
MDTTTLSQLLVMFGVPVKEIPMLLLLFFMLAGVITHVMPYLPPVTSTSSGFYKFIMGVLNGLAGNYLNASNTPSLATVVKAVTAAAPTGSSGTVVSSVATAAGLPAADAAILGAAATLLSEKPVPPTTSGSP